MTGRLRDTIKKNASKGSYRCGLQNLGEREKELQRKWTWWDIKFKRLEDSMRLKSYVAREAEYCKGKNAML